MRILWIAPSGGKFKNKIVKGTGGWIGSLQEELVMRAHNLKLGIAFPSTEDIVVQEGNVTYYPIRVNSGYGRVIRIWNLLFYSVKKEELVLKTRILEIIDEFHPDVVHVWGLENNYSNVIPEIKCPFVVHIQGFISPIYNSYFSPGFSVLNLKEMDSLWRPVNILYRILKLSQTNEYKRCKRRSIIETEVASHVQFWMGRTDWDRDISKLLSPQSTYFHCNEVIRNDFDGNKWDYHFDGILHIHSSISQYWYKGIDVILKTAATLKKYGEQFEWNVYGVKPGHRLVSYFERSLGIKACEVGVIFHGYVDGSIIKKSLLECDVYVHPSNIENSSNAIAEAMMLGVPVVAQYVGGNPSMLKNGSGVLVSQGEPLIMTAAIKKMKIKDFAVDISNKALEVSNSRQNKERTVEDLLRIYSIVSNHKE